MSDLITRWQNIQTKIKNNTINHNIHLIAVSKTVPVSDIRTLYQAGQLDFGENYIQEFTQKTNQLADLAIIWHIIGHVQSNKSHIVAERAHWVHTIDREKIAYRLNEQRPHHMPNLNVCIEVNISKEENKHGIEANEQAILSLANYVDTLPRLRLRGLMCVARLHSSTEELKIQFNRMHELQMLLQHHHFPVDTLSMGMSDDMDIAIACGATHIRIGRAIFGPRQSNNVSQ